VTPETQQNVTSSAFASPPSTLRRHPLNSVDTSRGVVATSSGKTSNRVGKFIHFLLILTVFVRSDRLNLWYLQILLVNTKFGHHVFLCDSSRINCWAYKRNERIVERLIQRMGCCMCFVRPSSA
jgi:hypothetical protein